MTEKQHRINALSEDDIDLESKAGGHQRERLETDDNDKIKSEYGRLEATPNASNNVDIGISTCYTEGQSKDDHVREKLTMDKSIDGNAVSDKHQTNSTSEQGRTTDVNNSTEEEDRTTNLTNSTEEGRTTDVNNSTKEGRTTNLTNSTVEEDRTTNLTNSTEEGRTTDVNNSTEEGRTTHLTNSTEEEDRTTNLTNSTEEGRTTDVNNSTEEGRTTNLTNSTEEEGRTTNLTNSTTGEGRTTHMTDSTTEEDRTTNLTNSVEGEGRTTNLTNSTTGEGRTTNMTDSTTGEGRTTIMTDSTTEEDRTTNLTKSTAEEGRTTIMTDSTVEKGRTTDVTNTTEEESRTTIMTDSATEEDMTTIMTDSTTEEDRTTNLTNSTTEEGKTTIMTDSTTEEDRTPYLTNSTTEEDRTTYLTNSGEGEGRTTNLTNSTTEEGKTTIMTDSTTEEGRTTIMTDSTTEEDRTTYLTNSGEGEGRTTNLTNSTTGEGRTTHMTDSTTEEDRTTNLTNSVEGEGRTTNLTNSTTGKGRTTNMTDSTTEEDRTTNLTNSVEGEGRTTIMTDSTTEEDRTTNLTKSTAEEGRTTIMTDSTVEKGRTTDVTNTTEEESRTTIMTDSATEEDMTTIMTNSVEGEGRTTHMTDSTTEEDRTTNLTNSVEGEGRTTNLTNSTTGKGRTTNMTDSTTEEDRTTNLTNSVEGEGRTTIMTDSTTEEDRTTNLTKSTAEEGRTTIMTDSTVEKGRTTDVTNTTEEESRTTIMTDSATEEDMTTIMTDSTTEEDRTTNLTNSTTEEGKTTIMTDSTTEEDRTTDLTNSTTEEDRTTYLTNSGEGEGRTTNLTNSTTEEGKTTIMTDSTTEEGRTTIMTDSTTEEDRTTYLTNSGEGEGRTTNLTNSTTGEGRTTHMTDSTTEEDRTTNLTNSVEGEGRTTNLTNSTTGKGRTTNMTDSTTEEDRTTNLTNSVEGEGRTTIMTDSTVEKGKTTNLTNSVEGECSVSTTKLNEKYVLKLPQNEKTTPIENNRVDDQSKKEHSETVQKEKDSIPHHLEGKSDSNSQKNSDSQSEENSDHSLEESSHHQLEENSDHQSEENSDHQSEENSEHHSNGNSVGYTCDAIGKADTELENNACLMKEPNSRQSKDNGPNQGLETGEVLQSKNVDDNSLYMGDNRESSEEHTERITSSKLIDKALNEQPDTSNYPDSAAACKNSKETREVSPLSSTTASQGYGCPCVTGASTKNGDADEGEHLKTVGLHAVSVDDATSGISSDTTTKVTFDQSEERKLDVQKCPFPTCHDFNYWKFVNDTVKRLPGDGCEGTEVERNLWEDDGTQTSDVEIDKDLSTYRSNSSPRTLNQKVKTHFIGTPSSRRIYAPASLKPQTTITDRGSTKHFGSKVNSPTKTNLSSHLTPKTYTRHHLTAKQQTDSATGTQPCKGISFAMCTHCEHRNVARYSCEECLVNCCSECIYALHPRQTRYTNHAILSGHTVLRCDVHDEPLAWYCLTCDHPICAVSLAFSSHASHDVEKLEIHVKNEKKRLLELHRQVGSRCLEKAHVNLTALQEYEESLRLEWILQKQHIHQEFAMLRQVIGETEANLITEGQQVFDARLRHLNSMRSTYGEVVDREARLAQVSLDSVTGTIKSHFLKSVNSIQEKLSNFQQKTEATPTVNLADITPSVTPLNLFQVTTYFKQLRLSLGCSTVRPYQRVLFVPETAVRAPITTHELWDTPDTTHELWDTPYTPLTSSSVTYSIEIKEGCSRKGHLWWKGMVSPGGVLVNGPGRCFLDRDSRYLMKVTPQYRTMTGNVTYETALGKPCHIFIITATDAMDESPDMFMLSQMKERRLASTTRLSQSQKDTVPAGFQIVESSFSQSFEEARLAFQNRSNPDSQSIKHTARIPWRKVRK